MSLSSTAYTTPEGEPVTVYNVFEDDIEKALEWSSKKDFGTKFSSAINTYLSNAQYGSGPAYPVSYEGSGTRPEKFELDYQSIKDSAKQISDELQHYFEQTFTVSGSGNSCASPTYVSKNFSSVASTTKPLLVTVFSKWNSKRTAAEEIAAALDAGIKTFTTSHTESGSECSASYPNAPIE